MPRTIYRCAQLLLGLTLLLACGHAAWAEKRVALVLGNSAYKEAPLKNPVNDARAMAAKLKDLGFTVILRENATKLEMERAVADFGDQLNAEAVGLFFYAGHGMQVDGRNFLVPVDARIATQARVRLETLDVDLVLDQMAVAGSRVNLVVLDACRNNPFERRFRATGGGLAQINAPQGTLIAYATAPGKVAADGSGANGLYTAELVRALDNPGLQVEEVFKRVRIEVAKASDGNQTPWEASSLTGSFYFRQAAPLAPPPAPAPAPVVQPAPAPAIDREAMFWNSIQDSGNPSLFEAYLQQFPNGLFAPIARAKIEEARKPKPAPVPVALPAPRPEPPPSVASTANPPDRNTITAAPPVTSRDAASVPVRPRADAPARAGRDPLAAALAGSGAADGNAIKPAPPVGSGDALAAALPPSAASPARPPAAATLDHAAIYASNRRSVVVDVDGSCGVSYRLKSKDEIAFGAGNEWRSRFAGHEMAGMGRIQRMGNDLLVSINAFTPGAPPERRDNISFSFLVPGDRIARDGTFTFRGGQNTASNSRCGKYTIDFAVK